MTSRRVAVLAAAATASLLAITGPAAGSGGEIGGSGDWYHLTDGWSGTTDRVFQYGRDNDDVYVGDWNRDGVDTLAVRRGHTYHFSNRLSGGSADRVVTYGRSSDTVLFGDWDGDGIDTPVVRRGHEYHFKNSLSGGDADAVVFYGRPDDVVIVGDWNGDGRDTLGVRRGDVYHLKNSIRGGDADAVVTYGRARDEVIVGDWNGDGRDTLGIRRGNVFHIKNSISGGNADWAMTYGRSSDAVLVGDWDGNRSDTIGVRNDRPGQVVTPPTDAFSRYDDRMIQLINAERRAAGVPEIQAWPALRAGALRHSQWMVDNDFQHATGETIQRDTQRAGCSGGWAENIAYGGGGSYATDPSGLMDLYMNSAGHRANILDRNHRYVSVGTVQAADGSVYNTQRFAPRCS